MLNFGRQLSEYFWVGHKVFIFKRNGFTFWGAGCGGGSSVRVGFYLPSERESAQKERNFHMVMNYTLLELTSLKMRFVVL